MSRVLFYRYASVRPPPSRSHILLCRVQRSQLQFDICEYLYCHRSRFLLVILLVFFLPSIFHLLLFISPVAVRQIQWTVCVWACAYFFLSLIHSITVSFTSPILKWNLCSVCNAYLLVYSVLFISFATFLIDSIDFYCLDFCFIFVRFCLYCAHFLFPACSLSEVYNCAWSAWAHRVPNGFKTTWTCEHDASINIQIDLK